MDKSFSVKVMAISAPFRIEKQQMIALALFKKKKKCELEGIMCQSRLFQKIRSHPRVNY